MSTPHAVPQAPVEHVVYKAVNRPLLMCGVERRLFFMALMLGAAVFNLFYSFAGGLLTTSAFYVFALWASRSDAQMLRILITSSGHRARYDCAKHMPLSVEVI